MKKITSLFVFGFLIITLNAEAAPASNDVFFLVMGGRTSCGSAPAPVNQALYTPFMTMLKTLKTEFREQKFHYIITCLNASAPPSGQTQYITSEDPSNVQTGDSDEVLAEADKALLTYGNASVFVIGHSYGGWMAMYVGDKLGKGQLDGLFTVDPIGPKCGPSGVIFGSSACHSAPDDLDNAAIKNHTKRWVNFYQDQDTWLNSSAIADAENVHIQYRGPHTEIDKDPRTWSGINDAVKKSLK